MKSNSKPNSVGIDVVGIGNAIVDVIVYTEDSFLDSNSLNKGNMTLLDENQAERLYSKVGQGVKSSGGSVANTLAGISQLGGNTAFIGRVKDDDLGSIFSREISNTGTIFETPPTLEGPSTARCLILVTPDAERTMCTYLGASVFLEPKDLDFSIIEKTKILYLEGYLFDNESAKESFYAAAKFAKKANKRVSLSLSDSFCVDRHREDFLNLINKYVDILFANESEIISLFESDNLGTALREVKRYCEVNIITCGKDGSRIITTDNDYKINAYTFGKVIDTTGAGDIYASGFLYGFIKQKDLVTCGKMGSICAGKIITQLGSRPKTSLEDLITDHLYS